MCGRQGLNTENSVFPRESSACSNLFKLCSSGSGAKHKERASASSTVCPEFVHTADGLTGMGLLLGEEVADGSTPSLPSLSHGNCVLLNTRVQVFC